MCHPSSCAFGTKDEKERKKKKNRNNEKTHPHYLSIINSGFPDVLSMDIQGYLQT